jgi:hypothetical protein
VDGSGNQLPGNEASMRVTWILDTMAPVFERNPVATPTTTDQDAVAISGEVRDPITLSESAVPASIRLHIDGQLVPVRADGTFAAILTLAEGVNNLTVTATDAAGNFVSSVVTVTRDSFAPALVLDDIPGRVASASLLISGVTEPGAQLSINGQGVTVLSDGVFEKEVFLARGQNVIEVRSEDRAGNENVAHVSVQFEKELEPVGVGAAVVIGIAVAAAIIGFLAGWLVPKMLRGPEEEEPPLAEGMPPPSEGAAPPPPAPAPEGAAPPETPPTGAPAAETPPPTEEAPAGPPAEVDEKIARLEKAFQEGKIPKEVYEENLRKLKGE